MPDTKTEKSFPTWVRAALLMIVSAVAGGSGSAAVMSYRLAAVEKHVETLAITVEKQGNDLTAAAAGIKRLDEIHTDQAIKLRQLEIDRDRDRQLLTDIDRKLSVLLDRSGKPMP